MQQPAPDQRLDRSRGTKQLPLVELAVGAFVLLMAASPLVLVARSQLGAHADEPELVWGERGVADGRFQKPRAIAIDDADQLYIVDMTARIQVFDRDGNFLRSWQTPEFADGKPTGLTFDSAGHLMVADTHYFRVLFYERDGTLVDDLTMGGTFGQAPGQFGLVCDAVQDSHGNFYVGEYGEFDRIQKFDPDGKFLMQWGGHGIEPGQFSRPQTLLVDETDRLWVLDACNHRVQIFDTSGSEPELVELWGEEGNELGQLRYPYDMLFDGKGHVYIAEFGNHRVQKFKLDGTFVDAWGSNGREPGQLNSPWALARDSQGRIHIVDTYNHRVQRVRF